MQRYGAAEQRLLIIRMMVEVSFERLQRGIRLAIVEHGNTQAQQRFGARPIHLRRRFKRFGRVFPVLQIALADAQIEESRAVRRLQVRQLRVGFHRRAVIAQLVVNVAQRREERGIALSFLNGLAQEVDRALALALQVQRHGARKRFAGALLALDVNCGNG